MSRLPFSAVVGQDRAQRALLMAAAHPRLGGVLLRGDKGSAKTTLARGLAALLPGDAPFVELPLGASEERVVGSLDLSELLVHGRPHLRPGLLAAADGGVLYVDEINLLADHLVDVLLDVAVSGVNRIERDGVSHTHPARFVLVGSMNPEEGEVRPQLLDRFGLSVDVAAPVTVEERSLAVRRQLDAERIGAAADAAAVDRDRQLRASVESARVDAVGCPDEVVEVASRLALEVGAEGLRADLMLCRAATASAALDGRGEATVDDVRAVAELVLAHRRRRRPSDEPGIAPEELEQAWERATDERTSADDEDDRAPGTSPGTADGDGDGGDDTQLDTPGEAAAARLPPGTRSRRRVEAEAGRAGPATAARGRFVRDVPYGDGSTGVDARATAVALATRRGSTGDATAKLAAGDLRGARREQRTGELVVFVVDASASMGAARRMAAAKEAVLGLLGDAYLRRSRVALVAFGGEDARVVLRPTASVELARTRLADLPTGGATPLAAGLDAATALIRGASGSDPLHPTAVVVTDGRGTVGTPDPQAAAGRAIEALAATGARIVVVDTEVGPPRLGLADELARRVGADHVPLGAVDGGALAELARG